MVGVDSVKTLFPYLDALIRAENERVEADIWTAVELQHPDYWNRLHLVDGRHLGIPEAVASFVSER
jgi:hypothetical protein